MKNKILQYLLLSFSVVALFSACRKDPIKSTETKESGKTFVWITEAPQYDQFFLPFTDIKLVKMFSIRRDPANKADLQKAITVTLTSTTQADLDKDTVNVGYTTMFNSGLYTDVTSADLASGGQFTGSEGITKTATGYTVNFAAGEFAKNFFIHVDGSKLDPSKKYVLPLTITNFGGFIGKVGLSSIFATIGIQNQYDGMYKATGTIKFPPGGTDRSYADLEMHLSTINANTVQAQVADLGANGYLMNLTVNADNTVTITPAGSSPASLQATGPCTYDPATKTFSLTLKYVGGTGDRNIQETITEE